MAGRSGGRVSLLPLDRIRENQTPALDSLKAAGLVLLSDFVRSERNEVRPALASVFGRCVLARSAADAAMAARQFHLTAVTLDGDRVDKSGAITGGATNSNGGRVKTMRQLRSLREKYGRDNEAAQTSAAKLAAAEQSAAQAMGRAQAAQQLVVQLRRTQADLQAEAAAATRVADEAKAAIDEAQRQIERLRAELSVAVSSESAAPANRAAIELAKQALPQLRVQAAEASQQRAIAQAEHRRLQEALRSDLWRRKQTLRETIATESAAIAGAAVGNWSTDLTLIERSIAESNQSLAKLSADLDSANSQLESLQQTVEDARKAVMIAERDAATAASTVERRIGQRAAAAAMRAEAMEKLRAIGPLPADAFEKYRHLSLNDLLVRLRSVNDKLRQCSGVNRKAVDQFRSFSEQRDSLQQRREELQEARQAIEGLLTSLDGKKDEAIERTFRGVAKEFAAVFKALVPSGSAQLVMRAASDGHSTTDDEEEDEEERREEVGARRYTGVRVRASFGDSEDLQNIERLSGGQRTLVALALIFAIQRCDPAPFYIFDEIDAALDPAHRSAVANMIRSQAVDNQFVLTTFRPELIESGDKFFGVQVQQRSSRLGAINKERALEILEEAASDPLPSDDTQ